MNKAYGKTVLAPTGKFGGMLRYEFAFGTIGPKAKGGSGICGPAWSILKTYQNLCWLTDILVIEYLKKAPADREGFNNDQHVFEFNTSKS